MRSNSPKIYFVTARLQLGTFGSAWLEFTCSRSEQEGLGQDDSGSSIEERTGRTLNPTVA
jgi:hypothetical protein